MTMQQQTEVIHLYRELMKEARTRIDVLNEVLGGRTGAVNGAAAYEFGFLQLRLLCEVIALGALVAHGDMEGASTSKLQKEYSAERIVGILEQLHPTFYPRPFVQQKVSEGRWHFADTGKDYLMKSDLIELYRQSGEVLHRGTMKRIRDGKYAVPADLTKVAAWGQKIANLLPVHQMTLLGGDKVILCVWLADGRISTAIGEAVEKTDDL